MKGNNVEVYFILENARLSVLYSLQWRWCISRHTWGVNLNVFLCYTGIFSKYSAH